MDGKCGIETAMSYGWMCNPHPPLWGNAEDEVYSTAVHFKAVI